MLSSVSFIEITATADREEVVPTSLRSVGRTRTRSRTNEELEMAAEAREFTSSEIRKATRNFMRKVGEGTFGPVFYGKLSGGKEIAVRIHGCYRTQDFQDGVREVLDYPPCNALIACTFL